MNSTSHQQNGESLRTLLREAAAREMLPPRPAAETFRQARIRRTRRRVATSLLALTVLAGGGFAARDLLPIGGQPSLGRQTGPAQTASTPPTEPPPSATRSPQTTTSEPSSPSAPGRTGGPAATLSSSPGLSGGTSRWPAPPTSHVVRPYERAGADLGEVVAITRDAQGRVVLRVNRLQYFTAEQREQRTGERIDMDGRLLDESPRLRDFVVEKGATIYADWQFHENDTAPREQLTADQLLERGNQLLQQKRNDGVEQPALTLWMFHRGEENGPLAYLDDAAPELG